MFGKQAFLQSIPTMLVCFALLVCFGSCSQDTVRFECELSDSKSDSVSQFSSWLQFLEATSASRTVILKGARYKFTETVDQKCLQLIQFFPKGNLQRQTSIKYLLCQGSPQDSSSMTLQAFPSSGLAPQREYVWACLSTERADVLIILTNKNSFSFAHRVGFSQESSNKQIQDYWLQLLSKLSIGFLFCCCVIGFLTKCRPCRYVLTELGYSNHGLREELIDKRSAIELTPFAFQGRHRGWESATRKRRRQCEHFKHRHCLTAWRQISVQCSRCHRGMEEYSACCLKCGESLDDPVDRKALHSKLCSECQATAP